MLPSKVKKSSKESDNSRRADFWNGTLVDDYNFLMSEELICRCKNSLGEPFSSLNDLSLHRVSHNEFEKQYGELAHWCEKIYGTISKVSSNALTRYLRQKYYEELYDQGLMRLRMFGQYAEKLSERFPDLKSNIEEKMTRINDQWNFLESRLIDYLDDDFNRILQDLNNELFLFEQWLSQTEEQLWRFESIRTDDISIEDFQVKLDQHTKLQNEIKSRNSRVSTIIEICERLQNDYEDQAQKIPCHLASDLENRWHQTWINSVEIQCKLEERLKILQNTTSLQFLHPDDEDDDDIIPFNPSEYEKIPLTPSNSSLDSLNLPSNPRKRPRSPTIVPSSPTPSEKNSFYLNREMSKSKRRMSFNPLPLQSPSTFYYSLTNINEFDDPIRTKREKKTLSKLDVGYESEDETNHVHPLTDCVQPIYSLKKSHSDYVIGQKSPPMSPPLTYSLPLFEQNQLLPSWWRHSITSAYDTCSNPDIDLSFDDSTKRPKKTSLLIYSKKYPKYSRMKKSSQPVSIVLSPVSYVKQRVNTSHPASNSYDASAEYTDPEQSENDVDLLSSDFSSTSPVHQSNHYTATIAATTTTTYASDFEMEPMTVPSDHDQQPGSKHLDLDSYNSNINQEKIDGSEPCWDGYQNPLFYPLNSTDMDSVETTLKWEDQFLEMDQLTNSSSDDEHLLQDHLARTIHGSSSSSSLVAGGQTGKQRVDSDSDLDDFNYVINETEKQLYKARQSLEKKKRQQPFALNDRHLRKYDEVLRTCETNIQCLQQILNNLHRSKNSRLNCVQAIEKLETYLSGWHDMRQQVNHDRTRARELLYVSQEIIKLKVRIEEELARFDSQIHQQHPWLNESSLIELMRRINYEIESEKEAQQKLASYRADILLAEEHLNGYRMSQFDGPSSSNIDEHLHGSRLALEQLTDKIETYQNQLRTLAKMIDSLMPIERQIEQKLNTYEYNHYDQYELQEIQRLLDQYEQILISISRPMMPKNNLHLKLKAHSQARFELYRRMLHDFLPKSQSKHVSFDGFTNSNNNNSSRMTASSFPSSQYSSNFHSNSSQTRSSSNQHRRFETRRTSDEINDQYMNENCHKQSSTSSYISDDCKVLYIETVIEVAKPVFYERNCESSTTSNTEYHHHHTVPSSSPPPPPAVVLPISTSSTSDSQNTSSHLFTSETQRTQESSDEEFSKPVNFKTSNRHEKMENISQMDSGIEYDHGSPPASSSSSSTIFNQRTLDTNSKHDQRLRIPTAVTPINNKTMRDQSTLIRRHLPSSNNTNQLNRTSTAVNSHSNLDRYWNRLKQIWFRSFLVGLLLLFLLFSIYFSRLDTCSRTTLMRSISDKIICVEHDGLPTI